MEATIRSARPRPRVRQVLAALAMVLAVSAVGVGTTQPAGAASTGGAWRLAAWWNDGDTLQYQVTDGLVPGGRRIRVTLANTGGATRCLTIAWWNAGAVQNRRDWEIPPGFIGNYTYQDYPGWADATISVANCNDFGSLGILKVTAGAPANAWIVRPANVVLAQP